MTSNRTTRAQLTTPPAMLVGWAEAIIIVVVPLVVLTVAYLANAR